jgi:hypothetical protein
MTDQLALTIGIALAAAGFFAAAIAYIHLAPWHETPIGRWFVFEHITMGAVLAMVAINRALNGDITRTIWVTAALALAVMGWGVFVTIIRTQRQANPPERDHG